MPKIFICTKLNAQCELEKGFSDHIVCMTVWEARKINLKLKSDVEFPVILCDINASSGSRALIVSL